MAKDINLTSRQWNDLVFEDRPKDYGAYQIRLTSSRRYVAAFLCVVGLVVLVALLPKFIETVRSMRPAAENISTDTTLADLALMEEMQKQEEIIEQTQVEPPPPLKSTIQFVPPVIVADEEIADEDLLKTQDELQDSKVQISLFNVEGTDEELGVDAADLLEHQQLAGEGQIYDMVQQMPQFPGGDAELLRFLSRSIQYPRIALENNIQGTVNLRFAVMSDGSIGRVEVVTSPDKVLAEEAVRVIKSMPRWIPGMQNGRTVNVYYRVPMHFRLQN